MAVPTDARAESTSSTDITVRWTDIPASVEPVLIYRSTNGVDFALITAIAAGVGLFQDTDIEGLVGGTKYWYELSQDGGATRTDEFATWTHECPNLTKLAPTPGIPSFKKENNPEFLNIMGEVVALNYGQSLRSTAFQGNGQPAYEDQCIICAEDGKVVLDCSKNCKAFLIITTVDITSITIIGCGGVCPPTEFVVPPATTIGICGWPAECVNHGDDCFFGRLTGPLSGGSGGTTNPGPTPNQPGGGGGPGGNNGNCPCPPSGEVSIQCCDPSGECDPCASDSGCVTFKICGGWGPFTIETTAGIVKSGGQSGTTITTDKRVFQLCKPSNNGDVPGVAYVKTRKWCSNCLTSPCTSSCTFESWGCDEEALSACGVGNAFACCDPTWSCNVADEPAPLFERIELACVDLPVADTCSEAYTSCICDTRDGAMIAAGCVPCELEFKDGAVVTATDFRGVSASFIAVTDTPNG